MHSLQGLKTIDIAVTHETTAAALILQMQEALDALSRTGYFRHVPVCLRVPAQTYDRLLLAGRSLDFVFPSAPVCGEKWSIMGAALLPCDGEVAKLDCVPHWNVK